LHEVKDIVTKELETTKHELEDMIKQKSELENMLGHLSERFEHKSAEHNEKLEAMMKLEQ
jgi:dsRNA-specific ribonuclease